MVPRTCKWHKGSEDLTWKTARGSHGTAALAELLAAFYLGHASSCNSQSHLVTCSLADPAGVFQNLLDCLSQEGARPWAPHRPQPGFQPSEQQRPSLAQSE